MTGLSVCTASRPVDADDRTSPDPPRV